MNDPELEKLMRRIADDVALDYAAADEIADSPTLWWSVQRDIRTAAPARAPWPPKILARLVMVGVPVAVAIVVGLTLYVNNARRTSDEGAKGGTPASVQNGDETPGTTALLPDVRLGQTPTFVAAKNPSIARRAVGTVGSTNAAVRKTLVAKQPGAEIRSEFVALAYAQNPESGQLVRVKVPSSMMVSLGVVPTVTDPSKLIDAEVLVGDDGLTHAIRFIRQ